MDATNNIISKVVRAIICSSSQTYVLWFSLSKDVPRVLLRSQLWTRRAIARASSR